MSTVAGQDFSYRGLPAPGKPAGFGAPKGGLIRTDWPGRPNVRALPQGPRLTRHCLVPGRESNSKKVLQNGKLRTTVVDSQWIATSRFWRLEKKISFSNELFSREMNYFDVRHLFSCQAYKMNHSVEKSSHESSYTW
jgi:hypothetical protein